MSDRENSVSLSQSQYDPTSLYEEDERPKQLVRSTSFAPDALAAKLSQGGIFLKYGRFGEPHERAVWFSSALDKLYWGEPDSLGKPQKAKEQIQLPLLQRVIAGRETPVFRKQKINHGDDLCFSIIAKTRTLDLECKTNWDRDEWVCALNQLLHPYLVPDAEPAEDDGSDDESFNKQGSFQRSHAFIGDQAPARPTSNPGAAASGPLAHVLRASSAYMRVPTGLIGSLGLADEKRELYEKAAVIAFDLLVIYLFILLRRKLHWVLFLFVYPLYWLFIAVTVADAACALASFVKRSLWSDYKALRTSGPKAPAGPGPSPAPSPVPSAASTTTAGSAASPLSVTASSGLSVSAASGLSVTASSSGSVAASPSLSRPISRS